MKRRIIFALCLLLAALFLLSACGQKNVQQNQQTQDQKTEENLPSGGETTPENQMPAGGGESGEGGGTLVVYFSATNNTAAVAGYIASALNADTYAITPAEPYTSDDLNWREADSRVSVEHKDPDLRPALSGELPELGSYDTVFLGYPLWWQEAPHVVLTFLESVDLSGKTVIPFCTSSSSGLGESAEHLHAYAPEADWLEGQRFPGRAAESEVTAWVESLPLEEAAG